MFFNPLKIPSDRNVFFTSDTHFNHDVDFVRGARGFDTVSAMDDSIVAAWNAEVAPDDIILHLGDFVIRDPDGARATDLLSRLNGVKYLLLGNHNSGIKALLKTSLPSVEGGWTLGNNTVVFGHYVPLKHRGVPIVLCHFPIASWDGMDDGAWHLCGHSHGSYPASLPEATSGGKILDVGWDVFGKPVSFDEVRRIMSNKPVVKIGHH